MTSYIRLPEHMRAPARAYVEDHQPVGGFLTAVLSNDLVGAFGAADGDNLAAMHDWVLWLWNDIPHACWGSPEKVAAWLDPVEPLEPTREEVLEAEAANGWSPTDLDRTTRVDDISDLDSPVL